MRVGVEGGGGGFGDYVDAREPWIAIRAIALSQRLRSVEDYICMMHDSRIAHAQLECANIADFVDAAGNDEVTKHIGARSGQVECFWHAENQVGRTHLPLA